MPSRSDANVVILALKDHDKFLYSPSGSASLQPGNVLVVFGELAEVSKLRRRMEPAS